MATKRMFTFVVLTCIILNLGTIYCFANDNDKYIERKKDYIYIILDADKKNLTKNEINEIMLILNTEYFQMISNDFGDKLNIQDNDIQFEIVSQINNKIFLKMTCDKIYKKYLKNDFVFYFTSDNNDKTKVKVKHLRNYMYLIYETDKDNISELEIDKVRNIFNLWLSDDIEIIREDIDKIGVKIFDYEFFIRNGYDKLIEKSGETLNLSFKDDYGNVILTGERVSRISLGSVNNLYCIQLILDEKGKEILADITRKNMVKNISILLNNNIVANSLVNAPIENGMILVQGLFTQDEVVEFAKLLEKSSLNFKLNYVLKSYCSYI